MPMYGEKYLSIEHRISLGDEHYAEPHMFFFLSYLPLRANVRISKATGKYVELN